MLNINWHWEMSNLIVNMKQWTDNDPSFLYWSIFFCWSIWKIRNKVLFEDYVPKTFQVCFAINNLQHDYPVSCLRDKVRRIGSLLVLKYSIGFFDVVVLVAFMVLVLLYILGGPITIS